MDKCGHCAYWASNSLTDRELYDELRRRGWTGTLTRTETLE